MPKYPAFETFSRNAKRSLVYAQQEAEDGPDYYIGTEHILLGLFRTGEGSAYRALQYLGVDELKIRHECERLRRDRKPGPYPEQIIPTTRVRDLVVRAAEEANRTQSKNVRSGHLLAGLILEGTGLAAHMLKAQGIDAEHVVAAVERELKEGEPDGVQPR